MRKNRRLVAAENVDGPLAYKPRSIKMHMTQDMHNSKKRMDAAYKKTATHDKTAWVT